jgi:cytochrome b561
MYSSFFKLWHWLNALILTLLTGTVFVKKLFFSSDTNANILIKKLHNISINISKEQAEVIAKAIRHPFWEWHIILGYVLGALVIYRILLIFDKKTVIEKAKDLHMKIVKIGYKIFHIIMATMVITGLMTVFKADLGLSKEMLFSVKELHNILFLSMWFIPIHIIAVVLENRKDKTLIQKML